MAGGVHGCKDIHGTRSPGPFSTLPPPRCGLPVPLPELYEIRKQIFQDHANYQQGLYYFPANDLRVPAALRERVRKYGLDPKGFPLTAH